MREKLLALLKAKNERKAAIARQVESVDNVDELRKLNKEMDGLNEEIRNIEDVLKELPEENDPADPDQRTAAVTGTIPDAVISAAKAQGQRKPDDEGLEYRKAFQQFVTKGTPIPKELRDNESTKTSDITAVIPPITVNRIVEKLETFGNILPLINRTSFAAGIAIPTSSVKPVATWVGEGSGSDRQKKTTGTSITFTNYKLRCEISMSMEASTMALSAFEAAFERQVVEAMTKAIEAAVINGAYAADGTTLIGPKGILSETPATGQALTAKNLCFETLTNAEAALPQAYEDGAVWCMTKKTFMAFVGMTDAEGQPIARINYGIGGKPERTLLGRTVVLCNEDYIDTYSKDLAAGKIFAFLFRFSDYTLNTIYDMGVQRKQDWDTEDILTKAVMSVDGKVVDKNSLVTIAKA